MGLSYGAHAFLGFRYVKENLFYWGPFLDKDIVEFSLSTPASIIFSKNEPKYLLKKILEQQ